VQTGFAWCTDYKSERATPWVEDQGMFLKNVFEVSSRCKSWRERDPNFLPEVDERCSGRAQFRPIRGKYFALHPVPIFFPSILSLIVASLKTQALPISLQIEHLLHDYKMLYFIGLGLSDEKDISVRGLEVVKSAARVYLEAYTAILLVDKSRLV
jgi:hypothetical protein